jgi:ABC-type branched-subunit amino acid transport system substrate-binding protein
VTKIKAINPDVLAAATYFDDAVALTRQMKELNVNEFVESYKAEFKREPSYFAASGYAGCQIFAEAVRRAGNLDADKVREQLLTLGLRTPFGDFKVDQDGVQIAPPG